MWHKPENIPAFQGKWKVDDHYLGSGFSSTIVLSSLGGTEEHLLVGESGALLLARLTPVSFVGVAIRRCFNMFNSMFSVESCRNKLVDWVISD